MTKVYFTAPLVALLLFAGAYAWSRSGAEERARTEAARIAAEHRARIDSERAARDAAIAEQLKAQAARKVEREAREARLAAAREQREAALEARDRAFREQETLGRDIERLRRDVATEREIVARLQMEQDSDLAEKAALEKQLPALRANVDSLSAVLKKIAAVETERTRQAAAQK